MGKEECRAWVRTALGVKCAAPAGAKAHSSAKPQPAVKGGPRGKQPKTIDFEAEEIEVHVGKVTPTRTGEGEIEAQLIEWQIAIGDYWDKYKSGIELFRDSMQFASEEEVDAKYLSVTFTALGKAALDVALDFAGDALKTVIPHAAILIKAAKGIAEAWVAEAERAAAAQGEVELKKFLATLIKGIEPKRDEMRKAVKDSTGPILKEFKRMASGDNFKGKATDEGVIVGNAAAVLNALMKAVAGFKAKSPPGTYFQQQFSKAYADTPGLSDYISQGGRPSGDLYFEIKLYTEKEESDLTKIKWDIVNDETSSAWKLVTKRDKPGRVAESLLDSAPDGKPANIDLTKRVKITVEFEEFLVNKYDHGWIVFEKNPDQFSAQPFSRMNPKLLVSLWKTPMVRARALDNKKLVGSNK